MSLWSLCCGGVCSASLLPIASLPLLCRGVGSPCFLTCSHLCVSLAGAPGSSCRLLVADTQSRIDVRVRISDITLELVAEDAVDESAHDRVWESIDALNPYAGTSLSSTRVQAAFDEAEAGYGLGYSTWPCAIVWCSFAQHDAALQRVVSVSVVLARHLTPTPCTSPRSHSALTGEDGVRLRPEDLAGKGTSDDSESATVISAGNAGVGWDTVIRGSLASIGVSVVSSVPAEIAYFTIRGLQLQYGLSTWESFINVRSPRDMDELPP